MSNWYIKNRLELILWSITRTSAAANYNGARLLVLNKKTKTRNHIWIWWTWKDLHCCHSGQLAHNGNYEITSICSSKSHSGQFHSQNTIGDSLALATAAAASRSCSIMGIHSWLFCSNCLSSLVWAVFGTKDSMFTKTYN